MIDMMARFHDFSFLKKKKLFKVRHLNERFTCLSHILHYIKKESL